MDFTLPNAKAETSRHYCGAVRATQATAPTCPENDTKIQLWFSLLAGRLRPTGSDRIVTSSISGT
ncbi:MAG: hypothetical protein J0H01_33040 [Rhizobiales bacterium]|nr:hypothetical protein [Hyphomicrobiales bacterium]